MLARAALIMVLSFYCTMGYATGQDLIVEQAKEAGIKRCLDLVSDMARAVAGDNPVGISQQWEKGAADKSGWAAAVEVTFGLNSEIFATMSVTPTLDGRCRGEYTKVINVTDSCDRAISTLVGAKVLGPLNTNITNVRKGNVDDYFMKGDSNNCTMIRHESVLADQN